MQDWVFYILEFMLLVLVCIDSLLIAILFMVIAIYKLKRKVKK
jgi:hypothetical protein